MNKIEIICMNKEERKAVLEKLESELVVWIGGDLPTNDPLTTDKMVILSIGDWELKGDKRIAFKFVLNHDRIVQRYTAKEYLEKGNK